MATVTVRSIDRITHLVTSEHHGFVADEQPPTGAGLGMDPYELLLAALGS